MKNAFLKRLLLGLVFPFLMILLVIAVRVYDNVRKDKAESYTLIAKTTAENMNEVIQKYAAVVESAATNEIVISMDADLAEPYLQQIIKNSGNVWSHFLIADCSGIETAHTDGESFHGKSEFMLNSDGTLSAHPDESIVLKENWGNPDADDSASLEALSQMVRLAAHVSNG